MPKAPVDAVQKRRDGWVRWGKRAEQQLSWDEGRAKVEIVPMMVVGRAMTRVNRAKRTQRPRTGGWSMSETTRDVSEPLERPANRIAAILNLPETAAQKRPDKKQTARKEMEVKGAEVEMWGTSIARNVDR